jgi:hypothetical protein
MTGNPTPAPLTGLMASAASTVSAGLPVGSTGRGFVGWPAGVLPRSSGTGRSDALTADRPGSREAAPASQLVKGTVGHDEYLPDYRDDGGHR